MSTKEIIRIDKSDLKIIEDRSDTIDELNQKIQVVRKKHLMKALKESTKVRIDMLQKLQKWIDKLDKRLFSDDTIENMPIGQVMSLFKFVGTLSLKTLHQMNNVEGLLKTYIETENVSEKFERAKITDNSDEHKQLKAEVLRSFIDHMKKSAADAIVEQKKIEQQNVIDVQTEKETAVDDIGLEDLPDIKVDEK